MEGQSIANKMKNITENAKQELLKQDIAIAYTEIEKRARNGESEYFLEVYHVRAAQAVEDIKSNGFDVRQVGNGWMISWKDE